MREFGATIERTLATGHGLFTVVGDDDAVDHRHFGADGRILQGEGGRIRDDLVVRGVAGDDDAEGDDAVVVARHGRHVGGEGDFARAGDGELDDRRGGDARGAEAFDGVLLQGLDQFRIIACRHDGEAKFGAVDGVRGGLV